MEDNLQRVFSILISVILFFLLPLYMAFEKKDDISYALALKITTSFVDNVTSKGYLTEDMYQDYISELGVTANTYDVTFEHIAKKYYPVLNTYNDVKYTKNGPEYLELNNEYFDFKQYESIYVENQATIKNAISNMTAIEMDELKKNELNNKLSRISGNIHLKLGYRLQEEKYYTDQILSVIGVEQTEDNGNLKYDEDDSSSYYLSTNTNVYKNLSYEDIPSLVRLTTRRNIYTMNEGDQFTVIIKNKNTSIASVLFNTLTFGANTGNDTKVYINYGGIIQNMEWLDSNYSGE